MRAEATVLCCAGDFESAVKHFKEATEGSQETLGDFHDATIKNADLWASALDRKGDHETASKMYAWVHLAQRQQDPEHPDCIATRQHLQKCLNEVFGGMTVDDYIEIEYTGPKLFKKKTSRISLTSEPDLMGPMRILSTKQQLADLDLDGKRVFLRLDLNVGLKDMEVASTASN